MQKSLYEILQVSQTADMELIEIAYRSKKNKLQNATGPDSHNDLKALEMAYEILGNPDARSGYDKKLAMQNSLQRREASYAVEDGYRSEYSGFFQGMWESRKFTVIVVLAGVLVGMNYFLSYKKDTHKTEVVKEVASLDAGNVSKHIDNEAKLVSGSVDVAVQQEERRRQELELKSKVELERLEIERRRLDMERERRELQETRRQEQEDARRIERAQAEEKRRIERERAYFRCVNTRTNSSGCVR